MQLLSFVPYIFGLLCLVVGLLLSDVTGGVLGGVVGYFLGKSVQSFVWATASEQTS
jgi:membrane protein YqaA with SNARE-associated domain